MSAAGTRKVDANSRWDITDRMLIDLYVPGSKLALSFRAPYMKGYDAIKSLDLKNDKGLRTQYIDNDTGVQYLILVDLISNLASEVLDDKKKIEVFQLDTGLVARGKYKASRGLNSALEEIKSTEQGIQIEVSEGDKVIWKVCITIDDPSRPEAKNLWDQIQKTLNETNQSEIKRLTKQLISSIIIQAKVEYEKDVNASLTALLVDQKST